jgi:putative membrane protein insertion efficiency factor
MSQDSLLLRKPAALPIRAALFAIRCYKSYLSVLFAGSCRFEPTCSQYAYEAIERFGVLRGIWLGMKRLSRCHPFSGIFGYDPVPDAFSEHANQLLNSTYAAALQSTDRTAPMKDGTPL